MGLLSEVLLGTMLYGLWLREHEDSDIFCLLVWSCYLLKPQDCLHQGDGAEQSPADTHLLL